MDKYVIGWNMPGYLPEMDPETYDPFGEAMEALVDALRLVDTDEHDDLAHGFETNQNGPGYYAEYVGGYVYWIEPDQA